MENPDHCDFIKLRTMLITHMQDLQEVTQEVHYENYRSERLAKGTPARKQPPAGENKMTEKDRMLEEKDAELQRMKEMLKNMKMELAK